MPPFIIPGFSPTGFSRFFQTGHHGSNVHARPPVPCNPLIFLCVFQVQHLEGLIFVTRGSASEADVAVNRHPGPRGGSPIPPAERSAQRTPSPAGRITGLRRDRPSPARTESPLASLRPARSRVPRWSQRKKPEENSRATGKTSCGRDWKKSGQSSDIPVL